MLRDGFRQKSCCRCYVGTAGVSRSSRRGTDAVNCVESVFLHLSRCLPKSIEKKNSRFSFWLEILEIQYFVFLSASLLSHLNSIFASFLILTDLRDNVGCTRETCDWLLSYCGIRTCHLQTRRSAFLSAKLLWDVLSDLDAVLFNMGFLESHSVSQILLAVEAFARS